MLNRLFHLAEEWIEIYRDVKYSDRIGPGLHPGMTVGEAQVYYSCGLELRDALRTIDLTGEVIKK